MRSALDDDAAEMKIAKRRRSLILLDTGSPVAAGVEHADVNGCIEDVLEHNV